MDDPDHDAPGLEPATPVLTCARRGCSTPTRDGKSFCSDHVLHQPYAAQVAARWSVMDREAQAEREAARLASPRKRLRKAVS